MFKLSDEKTYINTARNKAATKGTDHAQTGSEQPRQQTGAAVGFGEHFVLT